MPKDVSPSRNFGGQFRVNYKCPNCGVHMRVPVEGYGRNGWNCRMFTCKKCKKRYSMHIATTIHEGLKTPGVGTMSTKRLRAARKMFKEDVDHLDLVFFNGHAFRPLLSDFLHQVKFTLDGIRKKVPGFQFLFPEEDKILANMMEEADQAVKSLRDTFNKDHKDVWSQI